jgi:hypothetical protein
MKVDMEKLYLYAVGVVLVLGLVMPFDANAGNVQWSIQMHFPITGHSHSHNPAHGTIGSSPNTHSHYPNCGHLHHDYHIQPPHNSGHYHLDHYHYYDGRYGYHYHQGRRYPVVHEFRNFRGEQCREFQMEVNIGGRYELAWGVACRDNRGYWKLER